MPTLCIIEDDPAFSLALERVMARQYAVHTMACPPEDLAELGRMDPDIIFIDCMLSADSGLEIVQRIRAGDIAPRASIILMSSYHDLLDEAKAAYLPGVHFLRKPCTVRQVMELVNLHFAGGALP